LDAVVDESQVTLSWSAATDAQTADTGLTYNLRIGSTPGGNEVLSAMSLADGTRTHASWGNMGEKLEMVIPALADGTYYVAVQAVDNSFIGSAFGDEISFEIDTVGAGETPATPLVTALQGNYPNPFNPTTSLRFSLASQQHVAVQIFNVRGQLVTTLIEEDRDPGTYTLVWAGRDAQGSPVSSGVYFARMQTTERVQQHKMLLLK
jgi:hypothetical protein